MQVTSQLQGDEIQVAVTGMVNTDTSPQLRQVMDGLWTQAVKTVQLDLSDVTYLSSAGVSLLLETRQRVQRQQGRLLIPRASPHVREVLQTCRLADLLLT